MSPSTQSTLGKGKAKVPQPSQFVTESDRFAEAEKAGRLAAMMDGNGDSNGQSISTNIKTEPHQDDAVTRIRDYMDDLKNQAGLGGPSTATPLSLEDKYKALEKQMASLQVLLERQEESETDNKSVTSETSRMEPQSMDPLSKEMLKDVIRYDGRKDTELLLQYLGKLDDFFMVVDWPETRKIKLAASKLSGRADMWWRNFKKQDEIDSWEAFKAAMKHQYTSLDHTLRIRDRLCDLQQTKSVTAYTDAFNALATQIPDLGEMESISYYLRGLHRNVRKLVEVMDTESKSLEQIQLSALRVGHADEPAEKTTALAA